MEPKSPKSSTAADAAAIKAVVAGAPAEQLARLTKPVADTKGFRTVSWASAPTHVQTTVVDVTRTPAAPPQQRPNRPTEPKASAAQADNSLSQIHTELVEIRAMLATLTESIRVIQTTVA